MKQKNMPTLKGNPTSFFGHELPDSASPHPAPRVTGSAHDISPCHRALKDLNLDILSLSNAIRAACERVERST